MRRNSVKPDVARLPAKPRRPDGAVSDKNGASAGQTSHRAAPKNTFSESPYNTVGKETTQHHDLRKHLIAQLEEVYDAKVVTYFTSFPDSAVQIDDADAEILESVLAAEHDGGKLLLVLNSPGGQALAAERVVNVCRAYSNNQFEVLVPHMAKSAATMICFGATAIHMSKTAELGPVDPQVPYWSGPRVKGERPQWISAEEYVRSYDKLIASATSGKAKRIEPFLQQLSLYDARYIERLRSLQKLSEDISVRLLQSSMMKGKSEAAIRKLIDRFLTQAKSSSHGRMIDYAEARKSGLNITLIDLASDAWKAVWELYVRSDSALRYCGKMIETSCSALAAGGR